MGLKDMIYEMINLSGDVQRMNTDIKKIDDSLRSIDRRLVRIETIIEFTSKGLTNKGLNNDTK